MSKPSQQNRQKNKQKRRQKRRQAQQKRSTAFTASKTTTISLPLVFGYFDHNGNPIEYTDGCDACQARIHHQPTHGIPYRPLCEFCDPARQTSDWFAHTDSSVGDVSPHGPQQETT